MILIILGAFWLQGISQVIYISLYERMGGYDIFKINLYDSTFSLECDNSLYGRNFAIRPVTQEFVKLYTVSYLAYVQMNYCNGITWNKSTMILNPNTKLFHDGIDSDKEGFIRGIGSDGIFKVNPPTTFYEYKGPLDASIRKKLSHHTAFTGGSEYYSLYFPEFPSTTFKLIGIDTANPSQWRWAYTFPPDMHVLDIVDLHRSCGEQSLIVITCSDEYYELNLEHKVLKYLCKIDFKDPRYLTLSGCRDIHGSSPMMYDPADCDVMIDLDINNSSGNNQNGFYNAILCNQSFSFLSDQDPDVFSDYGTMDSITIELLNPLDGNFEYLHLDQRQNVLTRLGAYGITLLPSSQTTNDSFELVIRSLQYQNISCLPTISPRFIRFIAYKNNISDTAYATLQVKGPFYNAGSDANIRFCRNESAVDLNNYLGSCYTVNGFWLGPSGKTSFIFDPRTDLSGMYTYIVGDSICGFDSAFISILLDDPPLFKLPQDTVICINTPLSLKFNIPNSTFHWSDGDTNTYRDFTVPGLYKLLVKDSNGCCHEDSFKITFSPMTVSRKEIYICQNQTYDYKGKHYEHGEVITDTLKGLLSCDTLLEVKVSGIPVPALLLEADTLICPDALSLINPDRSFTQYLWSTSSTQREIKVSAGSYTLTVTDQNGCTGSASISIRQLPVINYSLSAQQPNCHESFGSLSIQSLSGGALPFKYQLNGFASNTGIFDQLSPGLYYIKIIDKEGCAVYDSIRIQDISDLQIQLDQIIELSPGKLANISFTAVNGDVKYLWSVPPSELKLLSEDMFEIKFKRDINLLLIFSDEDGCTDTLPVYFKTDRDQNIYFPNIFSPNGDQVNDVWSPYLGADYQMQSFSIFDRWGNLIYHSPHSASWDGKNNSGKRTPPGVYIFQLNLLNPHLESEVKIGDITLIK